MTNAAFPGQIALILALGATPEETPKVMNKVRGGVLTSDPAYEIRRIQDAIEQVRGASDAVR